MTYLMRLNQINFGIITPEKDEPSGLNTYSAKHLCLLMIKTSLTWCNENAIALEGCKHQTQKFRGCNKWRCVTQWGTVSKGSFLLSVETNPGLLWFCRKIAPASQKIKCKTKSNRGLVIHVFTRFPDFEYLLVVSNSNRVSKVTGISLAFLRFALWLVSKTHISTNQIQNKTHPRLDHSFFPRLWKSLLRGLCISLFLFFCFQT